MRRFGVIGFIAASIGLGLAVPAAAHTQVVSSSPAASATASKVTSVSITFSEALNPAASGLEIVMTGMPGMEGHHPPMKIAGVRVSASKDRKTLVATLPRPLPMGTYDVKWHAAGADAHRVAGTVSFTVR